MMLICAIPSETNLKVRQGTPETADLCTVAQAAQLEGSIKCEPPNNSLYTFNGSLRLREKETPLGPNQLLLRVGAAQRKCRSQASVRENNLMTFASRSSNLDAMCSSMR
jgi:hypothetical protein